MYQNELPHQATSRKVLGRISTSDKYQISKLIKEKCLQLPFDEIMYIILHKYLHKCENLQILNKYRPVKYDIIIIYFLLYLLKTNEITGYNTVISMSANKTTD